MGCAVLGSVASPDSRTSTPKTQAFATRIRLGRVILVAPPATEAGGPRPGIDKQNSRRQNFLHQVQRLRGEAYLRDGAISTWQLTADGRHVQDADATGWHIVALDDRGRVAGCARYLALPAGAGSVQLGAAHSALAQSEQWGAKVQQALEAEIAIARAEGIRFVELGGWAIAEDRRCTTDALRVVLATYALAQLLGGCIGVTTATVRHGSSTILRKLGGRPLEAAGEALPAYYDPQYRCEMELLRFHSDRLDGKMRTWIDALKPELLEAPVYAPEKDGDQALSSLIRDLSVTDAPQLPEHRSTFSA